MPPTFFLVWNPNGKTIPQYRHQTRDGAIEEAERLARLNPECEFFVLQATDFRQVSGMQRVKLVPHFDETPF